MRDACYGVHATWLRALTRARSVARDVQCSTPMKTLTPAALEALIARLAPTCEEVTFAAIRAALPGVTTAELDDAFAALLAAGRVVTFPRIALV